MTLEQLVPILDLCQRLKDAGFPQDTALVWVIPIGIMGLPIPYVALSSDSINHHFKCVAAPTAGELMKWIRAKYPDAEITSRCVWPGAAWIVRYRDDSFKNAHSDTEITALAALVLEVAG